jgi:SAM-dependent methyltransferase
MTTEFGDSMLRSADTAILKPGTESQGPDCIVCGGGTLKQFSKEYRAEEVGYFRCLRCGHLTASSFTTDGFYDNEQYTKNIDTGWEKRNRRTLVSILLLCRIPGVVLSKKSHLGDCGCGPGYVVKALRQRGYIAYGYEPFPAHDHGSAYLFSEWSAFCDAAGHFDLITCIEVLEHLRLPDELLENIEKRIEPGGYLLVSTETFNPRVHGGDWYYLNPAAGHVSIYTETSLKDLMGRHGFHPVMRVDTLVWLFRYLPGRRPSILERMYLTLSELRLRYHVRLKVLAIGSRVLCGK